jgi:hypothetical protein
MKKEYDFSKLKKADRKYFKNLKEAMTMRLDPHVISYFKEIAAKTHLGTVHRRAACPYDQMNLIFPQTSDPTPERPKPLILLIFRKIELFSNIPQDKIESICFN